MKYIFFYFSLCTDIQQNNGMAPPAP